MKVQVMGDEALDALAKAAEMMLKMAERWREENQRAGRELSRDEFFALLANEETGGR